MLAVLQRVNVIMDNCRINPRYLQIISNQSGLADDIRQCTSFLVPLPNDKHDMYQRVVCIRDNITRCPECTVCHAKLRYKFSRKYFGEFCSAKCAGPAAYERSRDTMLERYGDVTPVNIPSIRQKQQATLKERYGDTAFTSTKVFRDKVAATVERVYGVRSISHRNINQHVLSATYDASLLQNLNKTLNLKHIANYLGVSQSLIQTRFSLLGITPVKHAISSPQRQIEEFIRSILPGIDVHRNHIGLFDDRREIDIYIPSKSIAVEVDGVHWHSEHHGGKSRLYHHDKTLDLDKQGIRLIHVLDTEWVTNREVVESRIASILGVTRTRIHARQCVINEVDYQTKHEFFNNCHIQGDARSSVCYGLYHNGVLVAAMSFGHPRFTKKYDVELIRFANILNTVVVGAASRLFKHFIRVHNPSSIISYSDRRWNTGNVYNQIGMTHISVSPPNYRYFRVGHTNVLLSRNKFQKHKLTDMPSYNKQLTEWDIMKLEGYDRIWDCGNDVFLWVNNHPQS